MLNLNSILSHFYKITLFLVFLSINSIAFSESPLPRLLRSALQNNGQITEAALDVEVARAQLDMAKAALLPRGSALFLAAPIFEDRGNALNSQSNWNNWGPFFKGGIEVVQPLYSFGMISSYRKAAESQIVARENLTDAKKNEVLMTLKEFYYGYLMARDLEKLVDDLSSFLQEAVTTAEENAHKEKKNSIKPHDLFRLKTALEDLLQKKLYATQAKRTALRALIWVSGVETLELPDALLTPEKYSFKPLEEYLIASKTGRSEFRALAAGQEARAALRDAKRAQSYPVFFLGGYAGFGWTPVRDRQPSPYAFDPFNRVEGGAGLGLKLDLEFGRHAAESAEQEAERLKLKAKETYAVPGIELQVKKAYWELEQAIQGLEIAERRKEMGKKWFVSSGMGWSIGITPPKDLLEALEGNGLAKKNYIETVYSLNMALGHLSQAVGKEITDLTY